MDCRVELGDFVRSRRSGLSKIYLNASQLRGFLEPKHVTHSIIPPHEILPREESAANSGATTSVRLMPGDTETATMFDRWTLSLTTGIDWELTSVRGTCEPEGSASRTRCRCRISIAVRRARRPSVKSRDDVDAEDAVAENTRAAAA